MSDFDEARLSAGVRPSLVLSWKGAAVSLRCPYFPVWVHGEVLKVPVETVTRTATGWAASGELKTERGTWCVRDTLTPRGNTLVVDREWQWRGGRLASVRLGLDLLVPFSKLDYWAIPYISRNGNRGSKTVPTGMSRGGKPWVFREERTTAPALMTLESRGLVVGSYTEPGRSEQTLSAACILPSKRGHTLRTFFPFYEAPATFLGAAFPGDARVPAQGIYACSSNAAGFVADGSARFRRKFYVVLDRVGARRHGYVRVWESAWRNLRAPVAPRVPLGKTEALLWKSIDYHWVEKGRIRGFVLRIDRDGDTLGGFSPVFSAGWCGPTMMLAWLGIRRAIRAGRAALGERAVRAAEFFIRDAPRKNGAFLTHFNLRTERWTNHGVNAVQMGGAAYWVLRCVELLRGTKLFARRIDAARWTDFALGFCDLALRTQLSNGAFASRWTPAGRRVGTERAMGVHAARAVLEAYRHTGRREYLDAAEGAARFYIRHIVDRETDYGDCTDVLNTTTENDAAGVPDFFIDLYRATGNERYLKAAVRSAEYCLSFMFTYNVHFPPETECGRRRMRTRGLAAISPETPFVCPFFALQANAFLELWKETGEGRWKQYATAVFRSSLQMMTERGDTFGLAPHLLGCRAEVWPVLDTVKGPFVWKKGMTGYAWHQPVWWPAAFNLLNLAVAQDRFPEVLEAMAR